MHILFKGLVLFLIWFETSFGIHSSLLAQVDSPILTKIEIPEQVSPGETFEILIQARNDGAQVERGYITVSFPGADPGLQFSSLSSTVRLYGPGESIVENTRNADGSYRKIRAHDPMVEGEFSAWKTDEKHEIRFQVTAPENVKQITIYIRATFCNGRECANTPTESLHSDQQGFKVEKRIIKIDGQNIPTGIIVGGIVLIIIVVAAWNALTFSSPTTTTASTASLVSIEALQKKFYQKFAGNLRRVCIDLNIDYALLSGEGERARAFSLVDYLHRRDCIDKLLEYCEVHAPGQGWLKFKRLTQKHSKKLLDTLLHRFNETELRKLSIASGIDYCKELEGSTLEEKARSLIRYCYRHNCFEDLKRVGNSQREDISWYLLRYPKGPETEFNPVKLLSTRFNKSELRRLCVELGIDYQELPGASLTEKAQALINKCSVTQDGLERLIKEGQRLRSDIRWDRLRV